ncbi:MAG TPA: glycosyltransferase family 2 protein [Povalibacter sp.]|nr:glycosyltransferase family 2 protein [Povalibacter sp.]
MQIRTAVPRVSVVMSVFNGAAYLRDAVDSVLRQSFQDFELIAIDDGSSDASLQILRSCDDPRIRIIRNENNIGLTRSLNLGLSAARGELIARQDADDLSAPMRLAKQLALFDATPSLVLVGTQGRYLSPVGRLSHSRLWWKSTSEEGLRFQSVFQNPFVHTSVVFRRDPVVTQLGGYDEGIRTSQDFELWSRVIARYRAVNLPEVLVTQRWHPGSVSARYATTNWRALAPAFSRNVVTLFGSDSPFQEWGDIWVRATGPGAEGAYREQMAVLSLATSMYEAFARMAPSHEALAERRECFANVLLSMAESFVARSGRAATTAVLRSVRLSRGSVAGRAIRVTLRMLDTLRRPPAQSESAAAG